MVVRLVKTEKDSEDRLINKFNRQVQASRILLRFRNNRYFAKKKTKRLTRQSAVKREFYRDRNNIERFY